MALIPSLSLWSSIKIPFSLYGKQKIPPSVPYVDSCRDLKPENYSDEAEPAREMVNLRVPTPFGERQEKPSYRFFGAIGVPHKKRTKHGCPNKPRTKEISCVTIPGGAFPDKHKVWSDTCTDTFESTMFNFEGEDLNDEVMESKLGGVCEIGECSCIPSVKPWTPKELDEIHGKYHFLDEKIAKTTEPKQKKNKRRGHILNLQKKLEIPRKSLDEFNTCRVPHCEESSDKNQNSSTEGLTHQCDVNHSDSDLNLGKECLKTACLKKRLTAKTNGKPTDADYYENKLAELYLIELGLKT